MADKKKKPPNPKGNPNIKDYTHKGVEARIAKFDIRAIMRRLVCQDIKLDEKITYKRLVELIAHGRKASIADRMAARYIADALARGGKDMTNAIIEIQGKHVEKVVTAETSLEDLILGSYKVDDE